MLQNFINKVVTFQRVCARTLMKPLLESNLEANSGTHPPHHYSILLRSQGLLKFVKNTENNLWGIILWGKKER